MEEEGIRSREDNCGSPTERVVKLLAGAGADPAWEITAGLCENTHNAQCARAAPDGARSSCRWTACANPRPAIKTTASTAVHLCNRDLSNWGAGLILKSL